LIFDRFELASQWACVSTDNELEADTTADPALASNFLTAAHLGAVP